MRHALSGLSRACHPAPTVAVTALSALLAVGVGLSVPRVVLFAAAVLTGQLSIGWSNDALDRDRDVTSDRQDKPTVTGDVSTRLLWSACGVALFATVVLSFALGWPAALAALTLVAAGWAYNLGLKSTPASALAYLVGFGALPVAAYLARPGHGWPPWWVPVVGALLGLAAHVANVLPDLDDDAATGVRGLPQRLGRVRATWLMAATTLAASLVLAGAGSGPLAVRVVIAALGVAASLLAVSRPSDGVAFRAVIVLALVDVIAFVVLVS